MKFLPIVFGLALTACLLAGGWALASDINNPSTSPGTNDFYTLNEIWNYLNNVDTQRKLDDPGETSSTTAGSPANNTVRTTKEIYPLLQRFPATGQTTSTTTGDDGDYEAGATMRWTYFNNSGDPQASIPGSITTGWNNVVVDNNTGLMWIRNITLVNGSGSGTGADTAGTENFTATLAWSAGITACENLVYAGYSDWRMPNIKELNSIVSYGNFNPAIDLTAFPATPVGSIHFWTGTTNNDPVAPALRWYVNVLDGHTRVESNAIPNFVRPVRNAN